MFSNSSIITPKSLSDDYFKYVSTSSQYFNSARFDNIHCAIYLAAFIFVILLFILKDTVYVLLKSCIKCCCGIKHNLLDKDPNDFSDEIFDELNFLNLFNEFKKSKIEKTEIENDLKIGCYK